MKDKINKIFHTDKWWGKTFFIVSIYIIFWFVFYGSWFLIPQEYFDNNNLSAILFLIYVFIIVPILSFYIPKFIKNNFIINKVVLYSLHIFLLLLSITIFIGASIFSALSHFSIG